MSARHSRQVPPSAQGTRLDVFLGSQPEVGGRALARSLIDGGKASVDGRRAKPGLYLELGQLVEFEVDIAAVRDPLAPDLPLPEVRVLFDDPHLCAIDKPAGLAAHPAEDKSVVAHTVASWARARFGELPTAPDENRPGIVHRLDRDTSGVMLVGKTEPAMEFLRTQFRERTAEKEYRCLVHGEPRFDSDWIERPIGTDPKHGDRMTVVTSGGRESSTFYEVLERFRDFAYVRCRPKTGRTHQIRVHMTSIGHSLVGDRVYRSRVRQHEGLPAGAPHPGRQCLHAFRLVVPHPVTHELLAFEAPLPADFVALLEWLRKNRRA